MSLLTDTRQYKLANADFVQWLQDESDVKNVEGYLKLQDRLSIGTLIEYMHSKNVNILLGRRTAGLVLRKGYSPFKATFEHKGLTFIWTFKSEGIIPFYKGMSIAINAFFKELDLQLEPLLK